MFWLFLVYAYLGYKYKSHAEKTAENDRQSNKRKTRVLLTRDNHGNRRGNETEHHHIVDAHPYVPRIIDLLDFERSRLVREKQTKHQH